MPRLTARSTSLMASLVATVGATVASASPRPNVLMIVVDDLSAPSIAHPAFGDTHVSARTPNIDRLINGGVAFTRAYAVWPSCAPSRQAFMSGAFPEKTQYRFYGNIREEAGRSRSITYMGEHFRNNGYATFRLDKIYHIGRDVPSQWDVTEEPFGPSYTQVVQQAREFTTLGLTTADRLRYEKFSEMSGEDSEIIELRATRSNGTPITAETLTDGITRQRALHYLDDLATPGGRFDASQQPFFMAVGFRRPHLPFMAPTSYYRQFRWGEGDTNFEPGTPSIVLPPVNQPFNNEAEFRKALEGYYACLLMTDDHIGALLDKLEERGLADNTIVVFFGDHGYGLGERNRFFAKGTSANVGFHTPIVFRVPGGRRNVAVPQAVTLVDIYPTLSDLCGLPRPQTPLDGSSLVPLLERDDPDWVENAVAFLGDNDDHTLPLQRFVWADGYKYALQDGSGAQELYGVGRGDPFEWTSLANSGAHATVRTNLRARMESIMARSLQRIAPDLVQQPLSQVVEVGRPALFTVRPAGNEPYTVQWYRSGVALPGQTSPSLRLDAVTTGDAGTYTATLVNRHGRTFSFPAELRVIATAGATFDWMIDNTHPPFLLDGTNGAPFETIDNLGSGKFNNTLQICYYSDRDGDGFVRPGVPYGSYRVSIHRPGFGNPTTAAVHTVRHLGGNADVVVNLNDSTRGWQLLGTYTLGPASELAISTQVPRAEWNSRYVVFDGARFERLSAPANAVPVAVDDGARTTAPDTAVVVTVLANDTDGDGDALSLRQVSGGLLGTVTVSGGTVTYTPFPGVLSGTDTIVYQATDGKHVSNPASFTVTIVQAPGTSAVQVTTNDAGTVTRTGNASAYADGTPVTFTATPFPGYQFYHWDGAVESTQNPLTLPIVGATTLRAVFRPLTQITSYTAWTNLHPWSGAGASSARTADPDGDGVNNLAEYAFVFDPLRADADFTSGVELAGTDVLRLRYRRNLRAQDVAYTVKVSGNLETWASFAGVTRVSDWNPDGNFTSQEVEVDVPLVDGSRFVRVEAVVP